MTTHENEPKVNLLLVDDQPKNLLALEAILEPLGQNLVRATSGAQALKELLRQEFAVILLDVQMPDMDGFETARLIKQRPKSQHVPIIFLTAISKEEQLVFRGYEVGAVDYLSKPFNPEVLRSKVNVFIELFRKNEKIKQQSELLRIRREREMAELKRASEQRYRDLAESMPQIVWTADANGDFTFRNRRWWETSGLRDAEDEKADWSSVLHPDDRDLFLRQWQNAIDTAENWEAEFRFGNAGTGHYRWHLVRAIPVRAPAKRGERGAVTSWIGTSTDIDDRKHAEEALRLLAEASTALAASLDSRAALDEVARLALPMLGDWCMIDLAGDDGRGRRIVAVHGDGVAPDDAPGSERLDEAARAIGVDQVLTTGRRQVVLDVADAAADHAGRDHEQLETLRALGFRAFMCVPITSREGVLGTLSFMSRQPSRRYRSIDVGLAEDLARRVAAALDNSRLYAVAERERAQLAQANRAKDEFLAVLSHELRTPLNSMLGWTQIVRAGGLDEKTLARAMDTIERNARTQAQLIADLLDVSRIVTGKLSVDLRRASIAQIVDQAVDAARPAATAKSIALTWECSLREGDVEGDPDRLQQVVSNLLSNAIKFTPESGHVTVMLGRDGDDAVLRVRDDGKGIAPEFLPHVFERFRQGEGATTRAHGGLGLGLAIVRHLVEVHRGSVKAESDGLGKGSTFTVRLPLLAPVERAEPAPSDEGPDADALRGVHVLVVEDDDDGRELLEMLLADFGARVTAVANAQEAVERVRSERPDIVVSDIGLPQEDGYALLKRVRALPEEEGGRTPAIALTAYASGDDRARALAAGFEAHVTKPVEPQELAAAVASLVDVPRQRATPDRAASGADLRA